MGTFNRKLKEADIEANGTQFDHKQITHGTSAPSTKPAAKDLLYFATTAQKLYVSTGTSASTDWKEVKAADPA